MASKKRKLPESFCEEDKNQNLFLKGINVFIVQASIQKVRIQIFKEQIRKYGGTVQDEIKENTDFIVVDDKMDLERLCRILKVDTPPASPILQTAWLSACFKQKDFVDIASYELDKSKFKSELPKDKKQDENKAENSADTKSADENDVPVSKPPKVGVMFHATKKPRLDEGEKAGSDDSDYEPSDGEDDHQFEDLPGTSSSDVTPQTSPSKNLPKGHWVCAQSSKNTQENYNKHVTDKLEEMVKKYKSTNDTWRAFGYQKAIQALRRQNKEITTWEEAKALPGVGARLADKIWEIIESGELRKLNEFKSSDEIKVMELFTNVWGAGAHTARTWYQQGFRTLEDLRTKANLTHQQKIGLKHYDDINDRMPWEEAGEIEKFVRETAESIQDGIIAQGCGSYRRKKLTCGDVDVLVTHPDGKSHRGLFQKLLTKLKEKGFLTDDLVTAEDNGNQKKYLGVCKLPGESRRHRRLDIIVVPYDEYACALVYFTGSAHFNRSLRHLAKKMNMSLSEHSLNVGVVRNGSEKIYEGTPVPTPSEESVFVKMGIPYRPPEERDH